MERGDMTRPRGNNDLIKSPDTGVVAENLALSAEPVAWRKQYEYYRDRLLTFEEATA